MLRVLDERIGGRDFNQPSQIHDPYPPRHVPDNREVVGDKQVARLKLLLKIGHQIEYLRSDNPLIPNDNDHMEALSFAIGQAVQREARQEAQVFVSV